MSTPLKNYFLRLRWLRPSTWKGFIREQEQLRRECDQLRDDVQMLTEHLARPYRAAMPHFAGARKNPLNEHELRVFSQFGEDGILLYLFSLLGVERKTFVEFGCGHGAECNTANLSLTLGWRGLLMDADETKADRAQQFYIGQLGEHAGRVEILACRITKDNINTLFEGHAPRHGLDLLSIDIDGNDYWVWRAIEAVKPRIVVIEYNSSLGPERSVTVPYKDGFDRFAEHPSGYYHGASLAALTHLAHAKGYLLAGCESHGANAFFVRRDVAEGNLEEMPVAEAFFDLERRRNQHDLETQFELIRHLGFVVVGEDGEPA